MIGRTIGKYRIVGQLGRGGMGTVYKAVDETLDREVAIKVLNPELADTDIMKRFRAEATTLAKLNHPEIATIYELFRSETDLLMVMEFVKGETLDKISDRLGPMPADRAAYLIDKLLSALEHAHRAGVVHRDMKPANVMVTEIGGVKIMDFGIARVRGAEHMTVDGYMMGTPAYMPPEQVLGQEVDGRADLYAVGVVFYRLLTGALPFKADTAIGMVQKQISETPTPINSLREDLPPWCETILQRALAKSPSDRFQTAEEFREALAKATGMVGIEHVKAFAASEAPPHVDADATPPSQPGALERLGLDAPLAQAPSAASGAAPKTPVSSVPKTVPNAPAPLEGATIVLRKQHFAVAGSLLTVLALSMAVLAYVALSRSSTPSISPAGSIAQTVSPPPEPSTPVEPAPPVEPSSAAGGPGRDTSDGRRVEAASPAPGPKPSPPARAAPVTPPAIESETPAAPKSAAAMPAPARPFLPLAFETRTLVDVDDQPRERDATVHLSEGLVTVTAASDPSDAIYSVPYDRIASISYSRGRDPLWNSPDGPASVARAGAGALGGIFRGTRHWVTLQVRETIDTFIVLRFGGEIQARRALAALEARTGHTAELVGPRKDVR